MCIYIYIYIYTKVNKNSRLVVVQNKNHCVKCKKSTGQL